MRIFQKSGISPFLQLAEQDYMRSRRRFPVDKDWAEASDMVLFEMRQRQRFQVRKDAEENISNLEWNQEFQGKPEATMELINGILLLVGQVIKYADRCNQYQDTAYAEGKEGPGDAWSAIKDLTVELFSVVMRLTLAMDSSEEYLPRTVKLLSEVRLERIQELDGVCSRILAEHEATRRKREENEFRKKMVDMMNSMEDTVSTRVLAGLQGNWQTSLMQEIKKQVSEGVKEETGRMLEDFKQSLREEMRQDVQKEVQESIQLEVQRMRQASVKTGSQGYSYMPSWFQTNPGG
jgi:hypothetical protein